MAWRGKNEVKLLADQLKKGNSLPDALIRVGAHTIADHILPLTSDVGHHYPSQRGILILGEDIIHFLAKLKRNNRRRSRNEVFHW